MWPNGPYNMTIHQIIGGVVLVATLISIGVVVTVIVSALRSLGRKSGPEFPGSQR